jgi:hypothetical protein
MNRSIERLFVEDQFEWDEDKRLRILAERDFDIVQAALIFENPVLTKIDDRKDYGETRFISLGRVDGEYFVVVYTMRGERKRLITAWKGGEDEKEQYQSSELGTN